MSAWLLALALGSGLSLPLSWHPPVWVERWLFNPRERTEAGLEAYAAGKAADAARALEAALRLAPESALARYNAGTGQLLAGRRSARTLLEEAAEAVAPEVRPSALYNLGNARLAAGDAAGAVAAYKDCLRADPSHPDAKFNLELALRELERERSGLGQPRETPEGAARGQEETSSSPGPEQPPAAERSPAAAEAGTEDPGSEATGEPAARTQRRPGSLPGFRDRPDMSAEEAAAILEAVENLERAQRRAAAARPVAEERAPGGKDW